MSEQTKQALPRYRSHKVVQAAQILQVHRDRQLLMLELPDGAAAVEVSADFFRRNDPEPGGYFVRYEDGYESFSPAKAFEEGYTAIGPAVLAQESAPTSMLDFGAALRALKEGKKVARAGWNGKGMWLVLMPAFLLKADMVNARTSLHVPKGRDIDVGAYIVMWTAQGVWQPGWLASQADMLATDWELVE